MVISAIKAQIKNPERVSVYVDGAYAFSLSQSQVLDEKIYGGLEVTDKRLAELKKASTDGKIRERILNYVMMRPHSVKEVRDYCWRKKYGADVCEASIAKLLKLGYLNDQQFAKSWIESRRLTKAMSQKKLRMELKQKGITDEIIKQTLESSEFNEQDSLRQMIVKKRRLPRYHDEQKLMQYLARQGFNFDQIQQALAETKTEPF